jgi:hypothetical protein
MLMAFLQDIALAANQVPLEASLPDLNELDTSLICDVRHNEERFLFGRNVLNNEHGEFDSAFFSQATAIQREIYATVRWEF